MRGSDERTGSLFSYVDLEARVRRDHPLRVIREIVNAALVGMDGDFAVLYPPGLGRPSIAPELLLRAMLLQAFYGIRSERQLMERMEFDLLFRWFVGLGVDEPAWDHSSFTKNRDRLLSSDHFSVDGTLIEALASIKSFRRKDGGDNDPDGAGRNAERGFHKEKRSNDTHQSTSDPQARLYKKGDGQPAKLCYMGHALMENRHGLAVDGGVTQATGTAEREAALAMLERSQSRRRITLGADKAYDVRQFVKDLRQRKVTPHIAVAVGVQPTLSVWRPGEGPRPPKAWSGKGRPPSLMQRSADHHLRDLADGIWERKCPGKFDVVFTETSIWDVELV